MDIETIEDVLIYHHKTKRGTDLYCLCGYRFRLGESIYRHTAEMIAFGLQGGA